MAGTPTVLIARTDAHSANLLTSDVDEADKVRVWYWISQLQEKRGDEKHAVASPQAVERRLAAPTFTSFLPH